jgi:arylformamidase
MAAIDFEAEYDNRGRVPEHPAIMDAWVRDAAAYREAADAELGLAYGNTSRTVMDVFHPATGRDAPLVLYIHGGYWRSLDNSHFSHLATGLNESGIAVAMPTYDLCPSVSMPTILDQLRQAARFLHARTGRRMVVVGHSAGGHLTAALVATDWASIDPSLPADLVPAGLAVSGLFDLEPLRATSINESLALDADAARAMSPLYWPVPPGRTLEAWVGGDESDEYLRQSRTIAERWAAAGARTAFRTVPGANHFTVIAGLRDAADPMTRAVVAMAERL